MLRKRCVLAGNFLQIFFMGTSWVALSVKNIKARASREITSRKKIIYFYVAIARMLMFIVVFYIHDSKYNICYVMLYYHPFPGRWQGIRHPVAHIRPPLYISGTEDHVWCGVRTSIQWIFNLATCSSAYNLIYRFLLSLQNVTQAQSNLIISGPNSHNKLTKL